MEKGCKHGGNQGHGAEMEAVDVAHDPTS